ncbi:MAG: hypothetical protein HZC47_08195 [Methanobacterium sp.]|uniref:hypothetical protein n=1 Tax=Methanobacterium sp. TaxID=2164 RepID=UPI003D64739E|nr:hypothetical protein [Methanobacterium sp.]
MHVKLLILFLFLIMVGISGCTIDPIANSTFGEKPPLAINNLEITNSSGAPYQYNGTNYYGIAGIVKNNGEEDTRYVKMEAIGYDKENKTIATNDTVELDPKIIQGKGKSNFYFDLYDPNKKIVRFEIKVIDVK